MPRVAGEGRGRLVNDCLALPLSELPGDTEASTSAFALGDRMQIGLTEPLVGNGGGGPILQGDPCAGGLGRLGEQMSMSRLCLTLCIPQVFSLPPAFPDSIVSSNSCSVCVCVYIRVHARLFSASPLWEVLPAA